MSASHSEEDRDWRSLRSSSSLTRRQATERSRPQLVPNNHGSCSIKTFGNSIYTQILQQAIDRTAADKSMLWKCKIDHLF